MESKTLKNTTADRASKNVKDIIFWGNGDTFKLISKASSEAEGWMKSTKAMQIDGVGCVVQVTTQQLNDTVMHPLVKVNEEYNPNAETVKHSVIAEALTFVPGVKIAEVIDLDKNEVVSRKLVRLDAEIDLNTYKTKP